MDVLVGNLPYTKLISKVGRGGNRSAVSVKRVQPFFRPCQERERRHYRDGKSKVQRGEPCADQAHVVIQRKPGHRHVAGTRLDGPANRADIGQQIRVRQHHAFRVSG